MFQPPLLGDADGSLLREAVSENSCTSRFSHLSEIVATQVEAVWDQRPIFNFDKLFASDISGRSRAFGSMVKAGMPLDKAAALTGLISDD